MARGDDGSRRTREEARSSCVRFSPTGREWAVCTTDGLLLYSLDDATAFDPSELDESVTPEATQVRVTELPVTQDKTFYLVCTVRNGFGLEFGSVFESRLCRFGDGFEIGCDLDLEADSIIGFGFGGLFGKRRRCNCLFFFCANFQIRNVSCFPNHLLYRENVVGRHFPTHFLPFPHLLQF